MAWDDRPSVGRLMATAAAPPVAAEALKKRTVEKNVSCRAVGRGNAGRIPKRRHIRHERCLARVSGGADGKKSDERSGEPPALERAAGHAVLPVPSTRRCVEPAATKAAGLPLAVRTLRLVRPVRSPGSDSGWGYNRSRILDRSAAPSYRSGARPQRRGAFRPAPFRPAPFRPAPSRSPDLPRLSNRPANRLMRRR